MKPLSLETISFKKIIRNENIPAPSSKSLTEPLMKQWSHLINIVANYRVMFTTINIMDASGMPTTKFCLLERAQDEAILLPSCFESIVVQWAEYYMIYPKGLAGGIEITSMRDDPILFDWDDDYNYDFGGCYFTRAYYKDGKVIKEKWFSEVQNQPSQQSPAIEWWLLSRDSLSLSVDGALIWHITKFIKGEFGQEDLIMSWTAKACRVTYGVV